MIGALSVFRVKSGEFTTGDTAPLAQLDRASDYGSEGQGFESLRARHGSKSSGLCVTPHPSEFNILSRWIPGQRNALANFLAGIMPEHSRSCAVGD